MHHVIIGNGITGISAANELRRLDEEANITIISNESDHFFSRTALMYEFCGQLSRKDLEPFERDHYERMKFDRIRDTVIGLEPGQKMLKLDRQELTYDTLLIACGSRPASAPWQPEETRGIGHFVTLQDLEWLKEVAGGTAGKGKRAAVVGGGLIGVESAEILLLNGLSVDFIIREKWYWPVALNERESEFIAEHMRQHGCNVMLENEVSEVLTEERSLKGLRLKSGEERQLDIMLVSIGVTPNTNFLEGSGVALTQEGRHRGVEVDEYLRTNINDVYAAGDCATVSWFNGVRRPEQLWYTGRDQGVVAAKNMYGLQQVYDRGPLYNSAKFFDIEYTTAGLVNFDLDDITEWYQKVPGKPISQRIVMQNDTVIGFNMIGSRWDHRILLEWIKEERTLPYVLKRLKKAQFDAEFSPVFQVLADAETYCV